jgi:putative transcriptional regulator
MDRDEILKKAQAGAIGMDEREQQVLGLSFGIGGILMVLLCVILAIVRLVNGQDAYDYTAIVFLYLAGAELHLYWRTRRRGLALLAAACGLVFGHVPAGVSAMDDQLILKNRLKVARAEKGLSQTQLAELVGVSRNTISSIETGQFNPTAKLALILCIALDKKFEELFYFE